jgi:LysM domain
MSLSSHLAASVAEHGRLAFHPDCPRCRTDRLAGSLAAESLLSRRTKAALAAGLLAFSTGAPPAVAQIPDAGEQQDATTPPGGEPPGLGADFDPGGDDSFDYEAAPLSGGPEAGGAEDEGLGAPVETEPTTDQEAPPVLEAAPAPPAATPEPEQTPLPAPAPPTQAPPPAPPATPPAPPTMVPAEPLAAEGEKPQVQRETRQTPKERAAPTRGPETHQVERPPTIGTNAAPPPEVSVTAIQPTTTQVPETTVPASQPADPPDAPVKGTSYTVRPGDSLWSIARRVLGPEASAGRIAREVNRLWELNAERIGTGNPSLLHIGTVLRLR